MEPGLLSKVGYRKVVTQPEVSDHMSYPSRLYVAGVRGQCMLTTSAHFNIECSLEGQQSELSPATLMPIASADFASLLPADHQPTVCITSLVSCHNHRHGPSPHQEQALAT